MGTSYGLALAKGKRRPPPQPIRWAYYTASYPLGTAQGAVRPMGNIFLYNDRGQGIQNTLPYLYTVL